MAVTVEELISVIAWKIQTEGLRKFKAVGEQTTKEVTNNLATGAKSAGAALEAVGPRGARGFGAARVGLTGLLNGLFLLKETAGAALGAITDKAVDFGKKLIDTTSKTEALRARLKTAFGDSAAEIEKGIVKFAAETPYRIDDITDAMIRLNMGGFKVGIDDLTSLGDLAAASGKDFGDLVETLLSANRGMGSMVDNFAGLQAKAKDNKLELKNVRTGLTEVVEAGDTKKLLEFFMAAGKAKGIKGGMDALSKTSGGLMSTLADGVDGFFRAIGDAGFNDAFRELLNLMLQAQGGTGGLATMIGQTLAKAIRAAMLYWPALQAGIQQLITEAPKVASAARVGFGWLQSNADRIRAFGAILAFIMSPLARVAMLVQDLGVYFRGGDSAIGRVIDKLKSMGGDAGQVGSGLEGMLAGVKAFGEEIAAFFTGGPVGPALQWVRDSAGRFVDFIKTNAPAAFAALRSAAEPVIQAIAARVTQVAPLFGQLFNIISNFGLPILRAIGIVAIPVFKVLIFAVGILWTIWSTVWGLIFDLVVGGLSGILSIWEALAGTFSNMMNDSILPAFQGFVDLLDTILNKIGDIAGVDLGGIGSAISGIFGGGASQQGTQGSLYGASAAAALPAAAGGAPGGGSGIAQQNNTSSIGPVSITMGSPNAELTPAQIAAAVNGALGQAGNANASNIARGAAGGVR